MSRIGEHERKIIVEPLKEPIPAKKPAKVPTKKPQLVPLPLKKPKKNLWEKDCGKSCSS